MSEGQDSPVPGRATIAEIARAAGVSTATVDRTLNNRPGVKARTRNQVLDAAIRLGYLPEHRVATPGSAAGSVVIDFVLPGGTNTFLKLLSEHLGAIAETRRSEAQVRVHHIEGFDPEALARTLLDLRHGASAIGVLPLDHPVVREAIREVVAGGVPVLTIVSDISNVPRLGYVGIDNRAAGRLAGHLLGRFMQPRGREVALFADRTDVSEEVTRLTSHLEQFADLIRKGEEAGRKLEFVIQEMGRETNTIGSKAGDVAISRHVFEIKATLEKLRELVQNVE